MTGRRRSIAVILAAFCAALCLAEPQELLAVRKVYLDAVAKVVADLEAAQSALPARYHGHLARLRDARQKAGDLDALVAIKDETDRLKDGGGLPEEKDKSSCAVLAAEQQKFIEYAAQISASAARQTLNYTEQYVARLDAMKRDFTVRGKISEALACDEEMKAVKESPDVKAAEFSVAMFDAARRPAAATQPSASAPAQPVAAATEAPQIKDDRFKVYVGTRAPAADVHLKRASLRPTRLMRLAGKASVNALLGSKGTGGRDTQSSYYYSSSVRNTSEETNVRLEMRARSSESPVDKATVLVQYFVTPSAVKSGKVSPRQIAAESLVIPRLGTDLITVDFPPVSVSEVTYRYSSYYSSSKHSTGDEFYGILVTVFDGDGVLVYQAGTAPAIEDLAGTAQDEYGRRRSADTR
ncbi:MAG: hypothetical protein FJ224_10145 [Lentisphaerae bacterium]|nr:hypothetical protein [Lentisphaerota bacterium]